MKKLFYFTICLCLTTTIKAQTPDINFLLEGNKNSVKLFWLPVLWPDNTEGFNIKRRENKNSQWVQLNSTVILPGNWSSKDLSNVEKDQQNLSSLLSKRNQYLRGITDPIVMKINEFSSEDCYKKGKDSSFFVGLSILISQDYDLAKLFGFGLEDYNIPFAKKYEYGLFVKQVDGSEKLIKTIEWIYGTIPEVDFKINTLQKSSRNKKNLEIQWVFNYLDYKNSPTIAGFNMYRKEIGKEYEKLNKNRIWVSSTDSIARIVYVDNRLKDSVEYVYGLAPVTIFNSETKYVEINYKPQNIPNDNISIKLIKDTLTDKVNFYWDFNKNDEKFIKGFNILRSIDVLSQFKSIGMVLPSIRSFSDINLPGSKYYTFNYKVEAIFNNTFPNIESNIISFFYPPRPSAPQNITASLIKEKDMNAVLLRWDFNKRDTIPTQFKIYETDRNPEGNNPHLYSSIMELTTENSAIYTMVTEGNRYGFALSAMYNILNMSIESEKSNIVFITIPTSSINRLQFETITLTANKEAVFTWKYNSDNYPDMKGFRIYNNNQIMFDENTITKGLRTFTSPILVPGTYTFQITAITNNGIESEKMPVWKKIVK